MRHIHTGLKRCKNCQQVTYCSTECQLAGWKAGHAVLCKSFVREQALYREILTAMQPSNGRQPHYSLIEWCQNRARLIWRRVLVLSTSLPVAHLSMLGLSTVHTNRLPSLRDEQQKRSAQCMTLGHTLALLTLSQEAKKELCVVGAALRLSIRCGLCTLLVVSEGKDKNNKEIAHATFADDDADGRQAVKAFALVDSAYDAMAAGRLKAYRHYPL